MKFKIGDKVIEMLEDDGLSKKEIVKSVFDALKENTHEVKDREPMDWDEFEQCRGFDRVIFSDIMEKANDKDKTAILEYFDTLPFVTFHTDDNDVEDPTMVYVDKANKVLIIDGDDKVLDEEPEEEEIEVKEEVKEEVEDAHRGEASEDGAQELFLYATNDGRLYRQRIEPIINNLHRKYKKGIFDDELAVKAFMYVADDANKRYEKEFGENFNVPTRELCARKLLDYYEEDIKGEWLNDSCKDKKVKDVNLIGDLSDYEPWGQARQIWEKIQNEDKIDALDNILEDIYPEGLSFTELNDLLAYDWEEVYKWLGLSDEVEDSCKKDACKDKLRHWFVNKETGELKSLEELKKEYDYAEWDDTCAQSLFEEWEYWKKADIDDTKKKSPRDSKKKSICDICGQEVKSIEKIGQHFCVCPECKRHMKESDIELLK